MKIFPLTAALFFFLSCTNIKIINCSSSNFPDQVRNVLVSQVDSIRLLEEYEQYQLRSIWSLECNDIPAPDQSNKYIVHVRSKLYDDVMVNFDTIPKITGVIISLPELY